MMQRKRKNENPKESLIRHVQSQSVGIVINIVSSTHCISTVSRHTVFLQTSSVRSLRERCFLPLNFVIE